MSEIFIKYNPYRLTTHITIDGAETKRNSLLNFGEKRLQEWIEKLPEILTEECRSRDFKIKFHGTLLDYEDVAAMAEEANKNKGLNIEVEHIPAKEVSDKENAITEIFNEIQKGPFEELKQPDVIKAFNMAKSSDFEVNVVATMSSGKSTLINALLGQKLMPAKQEACTATITEIKDNDEGGFRASVYDTNGDLVQTHSKLTLEIMNSLNSDPKVSKIRAEGDIPFVGADDVSLVLVDTPGPNNSRDPEHKAATYRMLSESSKTVVLYILNATQLATNDDYNLLKHVADSMKVGGKQSRDRFIFVINKLDDFKKGEDCVETAITKVREYLKDNGIENANIYPASALTALYIRTILSDSNECKDEDEVDAAELKVRKFNRNEEMHFENFAPLTPSARSEIEKLLEEAKNSNDANKEALIHCGIISIEQAITMYVRKYAKTAKIKNIVDTFSKRLESAKSFEATKQEISENQDKQKEILANIEIIKKKIDSGEDAKKFKERIDNINYDAEIKKTTNNIIKAAQEKITEKLSKSETKMSRVEAEIVCNDFAIFADNLQADIRVKLEDLIEKHIHKSANDLFEEYKKKISELSSDVNVGSIGIDPFKLMAGDISTDVSSLISNLTETESVKVGEVWVKNENKRWWKPWTWFDEDEYKKDVYENQEFVDGTKLAQKFFAPLQEQLYENSNNAVKYAKAQSLNIKNEFKKKFAELDDVLKEKLKELEECANNVKDVEHMIRESQAKLNWLEKIQNKVNSILDI